MIKINFGYLRMLYDAHLCNRNTLRQAVADEHITPEQYERITGEEYVVPEPEPESEPEQPEEETDV